MAGTKIGARKSVETIRKRYGVNPDGTSKMFTDIGRAGGVKSIGGGFANNPELARRAGAIGGKASRRTKNKELI